MLSYHQAKAHGKDLWYAEAGYLPLLHHVKCVSIARKFKKLGLWNGSTGYLCDYPLLLAGHLSQPKYALASSAYYYHHKNHLEYNYSVYTTYDIKYIMI